MKSWFLERRYSKQMINSQTIRKIKFGQRLKAESKYAGVGISFVIRYHPKPRKHKL